MVGFEDAAAVGFDLVDQAPCHPDLLPKLADSQSEFAPRLPKRQAEHPPRTILDCLALLHCGDIVVVCHFQRMIHLGGKSIHYC